MSSSVPLQSLEVPPSVYQAEHEKDSYHRMCDNEAHSFVGQYLQFQSMYDIDAIKRHSQLNENQLSLTALCFEDGDSGRQVARNIIPHKYIYDGFVVLDRDAETGETVDIGFFPILDATKYDRFAPNVVAADIARVESSLLARVFLNDEPGCRLRKNVMNEILVRAETLAEKISDFMTAEKVGPDLDIRQKDLGRIFDEAKAQDRTRGITVSGFGSKAERAVYDAIDRAAYDSFKLAVSAIMFATGEERNKKTVTIALPIPESVPPQAVQAEVRAIDLRERAGQSNTGRHQYKGKQAIVIEGLTKVVYEATGKPSIMPYSKYALSKLDGIDLLLSTTVFTDAYRSELDANNATFENLPSRSTRQNNVTRRGSNFKKPGIVNTKDASQIFTSADFTIELLEKLFTQLREGRKHQLAIEAHAQQV